MTVVVELCQYKTALYVLGGLEISIRGFHAEVMRPNVTVNFLELSLESCLFYL